MLNAFKATLLLQLFRLVFSEAVDLFPLQYKAEKVYCDGKLLNYIDFGNRSVGYNLDVQPAPVYIFVTGFDSSGRPILVENQPVVFDHIPGNFDYSDLKRVYYVNTNTTSTSLDKFKDISSIKATFPFESINSSSLLYVNYPIVNDDAKVVGLDKKLELKKGWCKGKQVSYFDLGVNPGFATNAYQVVNSDNKPAGEPVIGIRPDSKNYTAFWKLNNVSGDKGFDSVSSLLKANAANNATFTIYNRPMFLIDSNAKNTTQSASGESSACIFDKMISLGLSLILVTSLSLL